MVLKFIRWSRGYVDFTLESKTPERFINLCNINGVNIWNTKPTDCGLKGSVSLYDYKNIKSIVRKSKAKSKINHKHGVPVLVNKYKSRAGLLVGAVLFVVITLFMSSFIWSVNIIGAENISNYEIIKTLEKNGLTVGSYKNSMNIQEIQRNTMLEISDIGWMSINVQDSCANVEIKEKVLVPNMNTDNSPCNIVAKKDGVITDFQATSGNVHIIVGSAVTEGQLLVNSVLENKLGGIDFAHSKAKVYADVLETKTFSSSLNRYYPLPTGNKTNRYTLDVFNLKIPFSIADNSYNNSIYQNNTYRVVSESNIIPLGITEETEIEYSEKEINFTEPEIRTALFKEMALYEVFCKNESEVISRNISGCCANGIYRLNVDYVFNEDIAQQTPLYIENLNDTTE